ncbi:MAG TPA: YHS domain-containing protein [Bacteroidia bacterium]|jgi:YHS domain-containing protein|nr:YHS domain-containing protein [Bacteroidota bacterium]HQW00405.1 YHS domain-containing protein [Bacteroidia bacterium]MBK7431201.1 YHS domain-containing protein [Bacteroidota bacterium]MBK7571323.1 YHS domain-containing protein [Bacteroidota bacterium]MBK8585798.1 YHS domain-containing protein [Bacteroidota bacterium]
MTKSIFAIVVGLSLSACSNPQPENAAVPDKVSMEQESSIKLAEGVLVSTNDTVCGMSVGNEPNDTVTVDGKLFGFCSTGCKESFLAEHSVK